MTEIEFHVNQADKLQYSCRLLRKAHRSGISAVVAAELEVLQQLDQLLWQFSATDFLPHCFIAAPEATLKVTSILLVEHPDACPLAEVLINLGRPVPAGFERFSRLIEIASTEEEDRLAARERWKHYQKRGYSLKRHDQPGSGEGAP